ncbi:hypothetical protein F383_37135 [Gossypium arboreum]|uniref:Uncharacterized protein n=1 Tax=Gossypium arboreum TaxID=29729 RepID=A0A0B0MAJ3_GOSAR|nr:hypothetical protein F383_37135 [Gossypium arboreum]
MRRVKVNLVLSVTMGKAQLILEL